MQTILCYAFEVKTDEDKHKVYGLENTSAPGISMDLVVVWIRHVSHRLGPQLVVLLLFVEALGRSSMSVEAVATVHSLALLSGSLSLLCA